MHLTLQQYTQEPHCCQGESLDATLTFQIQDGGAGPYLVITAVEWACNDVQEIEAVAHAAKKILEAAEANGRHCIQEKS